MDEAEFDRTCDGFRDRRVWRVEGGEWVKDDIGGTVGRYGRVAK